MQLFQIITCGRIWGNPQHMGVVQLTVQYNSSQVLGKLSYIQYIISAQMYTLLYGVQHKIYF